MDDIHESNYNDMLPPIIRTGTIMDEITKKVLDYLDANGIVMTGHPMLMVVVVAVGLWVGWMGRGMFNRERIEVLKARLKASLEGSNKDLAAAQPQVEKDPKFVFITIKNVMAANNTAMLDVSGL